MDLKDRIINAIKANDKEELKRLQQELDRDKWLAQFNGNVPIRAWLDENNPNPIVRFKD